MHCSGAVVYSMGIVNFELSKVCVLYVTQKLRTHAQTPPLLVGRWWVKMPGPFFVPSPSLTQSIAGYSAQHMTVHPGTSGTRSSSLWMTIQ